VVQMIQTALTTRTDLGVKMDYSCPI